MELGRTRKVFPGGNTAQGFFSFYEYIIPADARRILILKGGPGVGKSTFIRRIGEALLKEGFDLEFHCCSSDNSSLDGLVVPQANVALIDGTAPHVVDPCNPGAVDEIIHLGDYWDEAGMRANREAILKLNREVGQFFKRAYNYLAQAKLLSDEIEDYYLDTNAVDMEGLNYLKRELVAAVFQGDGRGKPYARHLFASAVTPDGCVNYFNTLFDRVSKRFVVRGANKRARMTLVEKVCHEAIDRGYFIEVFHCGFIPACLEHVIIPDLDVCVITSNQHHNYEPQPGDVLFDLDMFVNHQALACYKEDIDEAHKRLEAALCRAVSFLNRAKLSHDQMEMYYVPNMDFASIDEVRKHTLERVFAYAREAKEESVVA